MVEQHNHPNLTDWSNIYTTHKNNRENSLFNWIWNNYADRLTPGSSTNLDTFKRILVNEIMFINHMKVKTNSRNISGKSPNIWKQKYSLLKIPWVKTEIKREIQIFELYLKINI